MKSQALVEKKVPSSADGFLTLNRFPYILFL
jgi:hypothetical protein